MPGNSRESASAVSAASRVANERARAKRNGAEPAVMPHHHRRRSGSLVLTALAVVGALVALLALMIKLSG
jgi:ferric-dicitrate binding protein FerR (iron transport regulator)